MSAAPAAWYAIATLLASMYYAEDLAMSSSCALRPSWSPLWALRAASYCFRPARAALLGVGVGAACCPSAQPWRLAFFCALALCDFRYFSGYGGHTNFVLLYTAAAMVLPDGFARCGVLRAVVAHQLGSAGVHKLRVGGRAWLRPETLALSLSFVLHDRRQPRNANSQERCQPHAMVEPGWVKLPPLIRYLLLCPRLLTALSVGVLALEILAVPIALFSHSPPLLLGLFCVGCAMHLGVAPCLNIVFPFNLCCYAIALLPTEAHDPRSGVLGSGPALAAACLLGVTTLCSTEDWPLNAMVLFPYNAHQMRLIRSAFGRFRLAHRRSDGRRPLVLGPCLIESCFSLLPAMYIPEVTRLLLGPNLDGEVTTDRLGTSTGCGSGEHAHERSALFEGLRAYVQRRRRFVDPRTYRCFDELVCTQ